MQFLHKNVLTVLPITNIYGYYLGNDKIKISKWKKYIGRSSGKCVQFTKCGASAVLSAWSHAHISSLVLMWDNTHSILPTRDAHISLSDQSFIMWTCLFDCPFGSCQFAVPLEVHWYCVTQNLHSIWHYWSLWGSQSAPYGSRAPRQTKTFPSGMPSQGLKDYLPEAQDRSQVLIWARFNSLLHRTYCWQCPKRKANFRTLNALPMRVSVYLYGYRLKFA